MTKRQANGTQNYIMRHLITAIKSFSITALVLTLIVSPLFVYKLSNAADDTLSYGGGSLYYEESRNNARYQQSCYPAVVFVQQHLARDEEFTDIDHSPARDEIEFLSEMGILEGKERNAFSPNDELTRAEYLKMVFLAFGHEIESDSWANHYTDMDSTHWAADLVATATELDIINGYVDGTFQPDQQITYAEAIKMSSRATNCDFFSDDLDAHGVSNQTWADDWYEGYMEWADLNDVYNPDGDNPNTPMARWQGAMLTYEIMEFVNASLGISMRIMEE